MKLLIRNIIFLAVLSTTVETADADWTGCRIFDDQCIDYEIADIFSDVNDIYLDLQANRPVMDVYLQQRQFWLSQTENAYLLKDGVVDILSKLPPIRSEFQSFAFGNPPLAKCATGTKCASFQSELIGFFDELADLKNKLPVIEKAGLKDKDLAAQAIMSTPPVMLFAMYRGLNRVPDWQKLPGDLERIFDEIADAEAFDIELSDNWDPDITDTTKTQRFCARRADKFDGVGRGPFGNRDGWDQIRVNRMTLVASFYRDLWKYALGLVPDDIDIGASILGEGATLGIPSSVFTWLIQAVPTAIDVTLKVLEVHRKNIDICKSRFAEVEGRLSSCRYFSEFVLDPSARGEYYDLVQRRFDMADEAGVSTRKSARFYRDSFVKLESNQYQQAFENLCDAYRFIGVAK